MEIDTIRQVFLWCFVINMGILLWWFGFLVFAHDWVYKMHSKWYKISMEKFDEIHYAGMALFKVAIFAFYLVPYIALTIVK